MMSKNTPLTHHVVAVAVTVAIDVAIVEVDVIVIAATRSLRCPRVVVSKTIASQAIR
ncbi:hypothetical protein [Providencia rettgeri]|uniref:hypothetical protein n=1 Tax=Providencia rettgeri TaxID=587 RepID=UPI00141A5FB2|nr:hypothetical protein [Providencia rettgeri]NIH07176.1 hypothetical protein [Providencia rettgeri]